MISCTKFIGIARNRAKLVSGLNCLVKVLGRLAWLWTVLVSFTFAEKIPSLNSELIRQRFGNYELEIIKQSDERRLANLHSYESGVPICRTLALTLYALPTPEPLYQVDTKIRMGGSIGSSLRLAGFEIKKSKILDDLVVSGSNFYKLTGGQIIPGTALRFNVYNLEAVKEDQELMYAVIAEAYHPAHTPPDLPISMMKNEKAREDALKAAQALQSVL